MAVPAQPRHLTVARFAGVPRGWRQRPLHNRWPCLVGDSRFSRSSWFSNDFCVSEQSSCLTTVHEYEDYEGRAAIYLLDDEVCDVNEDQPAGDKCTTALST